MEKRAGDALEETMSEEGPHPAREDPPQVARMIERFQAGDTEAFGPLYSLYFERVFAYLRMLLKSGQEAEDAAQQVFVQVLEALPGYRHKGAFEPWLFRVVRNYAISELKRASRVSPMDPAEVDERRDRAVEDDPRPGGLDWITDPDLMLFVGRLPLAQRQVLFLRYVTGMSAGQIAETLDRTPNDVRVLVHRAQTFLRHRLTEVGRGDPDRRQWAGAERRILQAPVLRARRFSLMP